LRREWTSLRKGNEIGVRDQTRGNDDDGAAKGNHPAEFARAESVAV
jgi:hypothetical protein